MGEPGGALDTSVRVTRTRELVYEMKIREAMSPKVISVHPELKMSELRWILRDNRISGVPVLEDGRLVGVVSVEDFINWLAGSREAGAREADARVREKMSREVVTLFEDEPLVHAVSRLESLGYGRLPVLERGSRRLVGVITKGDIIEGLLRELQVGYHEEEIQRYRASHFFQDMIADRISIRFRYEIRGKGIEQGGEVASDLKKSLGRLGIHPDLVRRAAVATYEAEMNVIIYAQEGRVNVTLDCKTIRIEVRDKGPGIPDVEKAMEPGWSTAPDWVRELGFGAGMGLPNIRNCADEFRIDSDPGRGTCLKIRIPMEQKCA